MFVEDIKKNCSYEICEKLCLLGYSNGKNYCIKKFKEDYVYDDDPSHPESHKAGEVRNYPFYYKNDDESAEKQMYEWVPLHDAADWISDNYNIIVVPYKEKNGGKYAIKVIDDSAFTLFGFINWESDKFDTREDAFQFALNIVLSVIKASERK